MNTNLIKLVTKKENAFICFYYNLVKHIIRHVLYIRHLKQLQVIFRLKDVNKFILILILKFIYFIITYCNIFLVNYKGKAS